MIKILENDPTIGMVTGNRFDSLLTTNRLSNPFYFGNRLIAIAQYLFNGIKLVDPLTGLRLIRWGILKNWTPKSKGFDIEAEMNYRVERQGFKIFEIPIIYRKRLGEKKLKIRKSDPGAVKKTIPVVEVFESHDNAEHGQVVEQDKKKNSGESQQVEGPIFANLSKK